MRSKLAHTGVALVLATTLAACGSAPKPKAELALSQAALTNAEQAGAREFAPVELRRARDKHAAAQQAYAKENMTAARHLSEQARADAELAQAMANAKRSQLALQELRDGIDLMRTEITRAQDN